MLTDFSTTVTRTLDARDREASLRVTLSCTDWVHSQKFLRSPHLHLPCTLWNLLVILNCHLVGWVGENDPVTTGCVFK